MASLPQIQEWRREGFLISTNNALLSIEALTKAFAGEAMHWATPLPAPAMKAMLDSSKNFGLYKISTSTFSSSPDSPPEEKLEQIGLARSITDHTTFAYLTDVYVLDQYQGEGLGTWLVGCVNEWLASLPYLRACILTTVGERTQRYYKRWMGMERFGHEEGERAAVVMKKKGPHGRV
jgi:hypothetical protein